MSNPLLPPLRAEDWPRLLVGDPVVCRSGASRLDVFTPGASLAFVSADADGVRAALSGWAGLLYGAQHLRLDLRPPATPHARDGVETAARLLALRWGLDVSGGVTWRWNADERCLHIDTRDESEWFAPPTLATAPDVRHALALALAAGAHDV